jgi:hypothetical protein
MVSTVMVPLLFVTAGSKSSGWMIDRSNEPDVAISREVDTCSISTGDGRIWVGRGFVAVITEEDETVSTIDPNETHADLSCVPSRDRRISEHHRCSLH